MISLCENCNKEIAEVVVGNFNVCSNCEEEIYKQFRYKYMADGYGLPIKNAYESHQLERAEDWWDGILKDRAEAGNIPPYWRGDAHVKVAYYSTNDQEWEDNHCGPWDFEWRKDNVGVWRKSLRETKLATMLEF